MIKKITQSKFIRNIVLVAGGTAGSQLITIMFIPVITRIYGPEEFGLLSTFMAVLGVVMPVAALSYPIAIVLPESDNDARAIAKLSLFIATIISIFLCFIILLTGDWFAIFLNMQAIESFMLLIPVAMFFNALQQIMQQWLIRRKKFKITARVAISQSLILNSAKIGIGYFYPFGSILILISTLGSALYAVQLWIGEKRWDKNANVIGKINKIQIELKHVAYKNRDFPFYRAPQIIINSFAQGLPVFFLAINFGASYAGYFALSKAVIMAPAFLIGKSVSDVFYSDAARNFLNRKKLKIMLLKATAGLAILGAPILIFMFFYSSKIFGFIFGSDWLLAGEYSKWVAIWLYSFLIFRPLIAIIPVVRAQRFFLFYEIISTMIKIFVSVLSIKYFGDDLFFVFSYSVISAILYIPLFLFLYFVFLDRKYE